MQYSFSNKTDDSGGFSTIFGDLVFGLLFVFFLLAIALVFNKPEEGAFASEVEALKKELQEEEKNLKKLKVEYKQVQTELAQVRKQIQDKDQKLSSLEKKKERMESEAASQIEKYEKTMVRLRAGTEKRRKKQQWLSSTLKSLLESQAKDRNALQRELARQRNLESAMRKEIAQLKTQNQQLSKDIQHARRVTAELDAIIHTLKKVLNQGGYPEILAEVQAVEEEVKEQREERRKDPDDLDEEEPLDLKLMVDYQADSELFQVDILQGGALVETYRDMNLDQLMALSQRVMKDYEQMSSGYSKEEKRKHRPRMHLTMPAETPYRQVEEILNKLKKIIPVTITS